MTPSTRRRILSKITVRLLFLIASVATITQVKRNLRKGQKSGIVLDRAVCRLTWDWLDAKLEVKARDLTDRFDSFIR